MPNVKIIFEAINKAGPVIRAISDEIRNIYGPRVNFDQVFAAFTKSAQGAVQAVMEISQELNQLAYQGAKIEALRDSYEGLADGVGANSERMLGDLRKASGGLISDSDLMLSANKALLLGVANTSQEMQTLLQVAIARGRAFGKEATDSFDDIVTGLGRASPLILDNLGIIIRLGTTYEKFAQSIGKSSNELTDAEKKQALFNAVMAQSQDILSGNRNLFTSNLAQLERMKTSIANLKAAASERIAGPLTAGTDKWASAIDQVTAVLRGNREVFDGWIDAVVLAYQRGTNTNVEYMQAVEKAYAADAKSVESKKAVTEANQKVYSAMRGANAQLEESAQRAKDAAAESDQLAASLIRAGGEMGTFASLAQSAGVQMDQLDSYIKRVQQSLNNFTGRFDEINSLQRSTANAIVNEAIKAAPIMGQDQAKQMAAAALAQLEGTTNQLKNQNLGALDLRFQYGALEEELKGPFTAAIEANKDAQKAWKDEVKDAEKAYEDLRGKVESVLSGALDPGVGIDPAEILSGLKMRPDAINEDARRLADIAVKGFKSPWYDYFKSEFPALFQQYFAGAADESGAKAQAAELLQQFQDGLRPEFIDKDKAKERVKALILGEQNMKEMAKQITDELVTEFGGTDQSVIARATERALGLDSQHTDQLGSSMAEALKAGALGTVDSEDIGGQISQKVVDQILSESNLTKTEEAGALHGRAWGAGFLSEVGDNVSPELLDMLANMLMPRMKPAEKKRDTLTGALP